MTRIVRFSGILALRVISILAIAVAIAFTVSHIPADTQFIIAWVVAFIAACGLTALILIGAYSVIKDAWEASR